MPEDPRAALILWSASRPTPTPRSSACRDRPTPWRTEHSHLRIRCIQDSRHVNEGLWLQRLILKQVELSVTIQHESLPWVYTVKPLGHAFPALSPAHVLPFHVSLAPFPSLH